MTTKSHSPCSCGSGGLEACEGVESSTIMRPHPRERAVRKARSALQSHLTQWLRHHELTTYEEILIITSVMGEAITGAMKYGIRIERHGDPNTPGGLAKEED